MATDGITGEPLEVGRSLYTAITILTAIAWYNVIELNFLIFITFKRYRGLYFWSMLLSSWGTALHALGFVLKFFPTGTNVYLAVAIITIGWYCMVTGQSIVLYSRVHLVTQSRNVLRAVLAMVIIDAMLFHIPTTVLTFGANSTTGNQSPFTYPYQVMEKIQMTAFSLQELIISGIYVNASLRLFRPLYCDGNHKPLIQLFLVNIIIIAMDISMLGVEYASLYNVEVMMKSFIYSVKLKLEFAVLTELKNYTEPVRRRQAQSSMGTYTEPVGRQQTPSFSRRPPGAGRPSYVSSAALRDSPGPPTFRDAATSSKTMNEEVTWSHRGRETALNSHPNPPLSPDSGYGTHQPETSAMSPASSETELQQYPRSRTAKEKVGALRGKFSGWARA